MMAWPDWIDWPWWISLFFVVGVLATVWAFATMFLALGRRPRRLTVYSRPAAGSARFLESLSGLLNEPLQSGGTARLLNNGDQIFPAILEALRGAEKTINFMTYIWEKGEVSDQVLDVLVERAKAGVKVRVMLDGMGAWRAPHKRFKELGVAGGRVRWFNPFRVGKLTAFYRRNHRRAIVVDGKVAFTGGASVGDKWQGNAQDPEHWRDIMVEVRGCLAVNLQSAFTQLWANSTGEILLGEDHFPIRRRRRRPRAPRGSRADYGLSAYDAAVMVASAGAYFDAAVTNSTQSPTQSRSRACFRRSACASRSRSRIFLARRPGAELAAVVALRGSGRDLKPERGGGLRRAPAQRPRRCRHRQRARPAQH